MRQSPDWRALARDHEAGLVVDASRYRPPSDLPGFPNDLEGCIQTWNRIFPVNFFRCRQVLKEISEALIARTQQSALLGVENLSSLPSMVAGSRSLLFFFDDDDWFAPDIFERVSALETEDADILVFPLVRFEQNSFTFVPDGEPAEAVVGARRNFASRFQTNNYAVIAPAVSYDILPHLRDHVLGSGYADKAGLRSRYHDLLISATNKTPCSASWLPGLLADPDAFKASVAAFIGNLRGLAIPERMHWARPAIGQTLALFETLLETPASERGRTTSRFVRWTGLLRRR